MNNVLTREETQLPVGSIDTAAVGWWGMWLGIVTEGALFAYLLFSYAYVGLQIQGRGWPPELPSLKLAGPNTIVLLLSSVALWMAERAVKRSDRRAQMAGLTIAGLLGVLFVIVQLFEWHEKSFGLASSAYGSFFFTITGFHLAHVLAGLLIILALVIWSWKNTFDETRHAAISVGSLYWHFVDAVWVVVFFTLYITPYLVA